MKRASSFIVLVYRVGAEYFIATADGKLITSAYEIDSFKTFLRKYLVRHKQHTSAEQILKVVADGEVVPLQVGVVPLDLFKTASQDVSPLMAEKIVTELLPHGWELENAITTTLTEFDLIDSVSAQVKLRAHIKLLQAENRKVSHSFFPGKNALLRIASGPDATFDGQIVEVLEPLEDGRYSVKLNSGEIISVASINLATTIAANSEEVPGMLNYKKVKISGLNFGDEFYGAHDEDKKYPFKMGANALESGISEDTEVWISIPDAEDISVTAGLITLSVSNDKPGIIYASIEDSKEVYSLLPQLKMERDDVLAFLEKEASQKGFEEYASIALGKTAATVYLELAGSEDNVDKAYEVLQETEFQAEILSKGKKLRVFGDPEVLEDWFNEHDFNLTIKNKKVSKVLKTEQDVEVQEHTTMADAIEHNTHEFPSTPDITHEYPTIKHKKEAEEQIVVGNFRVFISESFPENLWVENLLTTEVRSIGDFGGISTIKELKKTIEGMGETEFLPRLEKAFLGRPKLANIDWALYEEFTSAMKRADENIEEVKIAREFVSFYDLEATPEVVVAAFKELQIPKFKVATRAHFVENNNALPAFISKDLGDNRYEIITANTTLEVSGDKLISTQPKGEYKMCSCGEPIKVSGDKFACGCSKIYAGVDENGDLVEDGEAETDTAPVVFEAIAKDVATQFGNNVSVSEDGMVSSEGKELGIVKQIQDKDHEHNGAYYFSQLSSAIQPPFWDADNGEILSAGDITFTPEINAFAIDAALASDNNA